MRSLMPPPHLALQALHSLDAPDAFPDTSTTLGTAGAPLAPFALVTRDWASNLATGLAQLQRGATRTLRSGGLNQAREILGAPGVGIRFHAIFGALAVAPFA